MAQIVVAGSGICGMAAAMMLARDGHDVTVLERDEASPPASLDEAWETWGRRGVAQFRMAHLLLPRGYSVLASALPDVAVGLQSVGLRNNVAETFLAFIPGAESTPDDARFDTYTGRRPTIECVLAGVLADEPRVSVRRGAAIESLLTGAEAVGGVPHVAGVRLQGGEEIRADLVVDATGRRSPTSEWITGIGGRAPEEVAEDSGFSYYGRFYRSPDGSLPQIAAPILSPIGSISVLCIPSDNGTWSVTLYAGSKDTPTRRFREQEVFDKVVQECPLHAHWLDGEPISEIASMSGVVDRIRHFVVDGVPVVTGIVSIADAYACTNPSVGRGMSFGLMHTALMRAAVRDHLDRPADLAVAFHEASVAGLDPWHDATRQLDRARNAEMRALADGLQPPEDPVQAISAMLFGAAVADPDVARWAAEILGCLSRPDEIFAREGVFERILEVGQAIEPKPIPGPDRQRLLDLCS